MAMSDRSRKRKLPMSVNHHTPYPESLSLCSPTRQSPLSPTLALSLSPISSKSLNFCHHQKEESIQLVTADVNDDVDAENIRAKECGIYICDTILSVDECQELISVHESEHHAGYIDNLTITRFADLATPAAIHLSLPLIRARHLCWEKVEECFDQQFDLYPEFTSIMGWHRGSYLRSHFDANREYLQDRHYSAVLYLNDPQQPQEGIGVSASADNENNQCQFGGGDLVFEFSATDRSGDCGDDDSDDSNSSSGKQIMRVQPRAGRLVCFPSTSDYVHRVDEVTEGCRYSLTMWFTRSADAMETLESCQKLLFDDEETSMTTTTTTTPTLSTVTQPWETSDQAKRLLEKSMKRSKLEWQPDTFQWMIPCFVSCSHTKGKSDYDNKNVEYKERNLFISQVELRHLASYCWWQNRMVLGDITSLDEVDKLYTNWREYVSGRTKGLIAAAKRWKANGMITNVTSEEISAS
jgi:2OG-Fe(II) oxygenase superfamily